MIVEWCYWVFGLLLCYVFDLEVDRLEGEVLYLCIEFFWVGVVVV